MLLGRQLTRQMDIRIKSRMLPIRKLSRIEEDYKDERRIQEDDYKDERRMKDDTHEDSRRVKDKDNYKDKRQVKDGYKG